MSKNRDKKPSQQKKPKGFSQKRILPTVPDPGGRITPPRTEKGDWRLAEFGSPEKLNLHPVSKSYAPTLSVDGFRCTKAWEVQNDQGKIKRFNEASRHIGNTHTLYHGTRAENIVGIIREGLRPGGGSCMFGSGIYMGPPEKACNYMGWSAQGLHYMFEVRVALGKVLECTKSERHHLEELTAAGYHSVAGVAGKTVTYGTGTLRNSEYVVYSPDQVLAVRVYEFQRVTPAQSVVPGCAVLRQRDPDVPPGMKAFADIVGEKPCGNRPTMPVWVEPYTKFSSSTSVDICAECIRRLKLKRGDKIKVQVPYGYSRVGRAATVRIKGV